MLPGDLARSKLMQSLEQTQPQPFMPLAPGEALSLCGQVHMGPECLCCVTQRLGVSLLVCPLLKGPVGE